MRYTKTIAGLYRLYICAHSHADFPGVHPMMDGGSTRALCSPQHWLTYYGGSRTVLTSLLSYWITYFDLDI